MSPPPIASPEHPVPAEGDSGVRPVTVREAREISYAQQSRAKSELKEEVKVEVRRQSVLDDYKVFAASIATIVAVAFAVFFKLEARGQEKVDAGVAPIEKRLTAVEGAQLRQAADTHELAVDIRELYRSQKTGRRSERLEKPVPPLPAVDGGE